MGLGLGWGYFRACEQPFGKGEHLRRESCDSD